MRRRGRRRAGRRIGDAPSLAGQLSGNRWKFIQVLVYSDENVLVVLSKFFRKFGKNFFFQFSQKY